MPELTLLTALIVITSNFMLIIALLHQRNINLKYRHQITENLILLREYKKLIEKRKSNG